MNSLVNIVYIIQKDINNDVWELQLKKKKNMQKKKKFNLKNKKPNLNNNQKKKINNQKKKIQLKQQLEEKEIQYKQQLEEKEIQFKQQSEEKNKQIDKLENQIFNLNEKIKELALAGINRPTTNTTTTTTNNKIPFIYKSKKIENLDPLNFNDFEDYLSQLKSHHVEKGATGLAEFAMSGPLNNMYRFSQKNNKT